MRLTRPHNGPTIDAIVDRVMHQLNQMVGRLPAARERCPGVAPD